MANNVPNRITPLIPEQVAEAFRQGFETIEGDPPSDETLSLLLAQSALETGHWKKIHCYNFGNIKASENYQGMYCMFRCNEIINGHVRWFDPPHPQTWFRAYASASEGAYDYLAFLAVDTNNDGVNRYEAAWKAAKRADISGFIRQLKMVGYFTANLDRYLKAVDQLYDKYYRIVLTLELDHGDHDAPETVCAHSSFSETDFDLLWAEFGDRIFERLG